MRPGSPPEQSALLTAIGHEDPEAPTEGQPVKFWAICMGTALQLVDTYLDGSVLVKLEREGWRTMAGVLALSVVVPQVVAWAFLHANARTTAGALLRILLFPAAGGMCLLGLWATGRGDEPSVLKSCAVFTLVLCIELFVHPYHGYVKGYETTGSIWCHLAGGLMEAPASAGLTLYTAMLQSIVELSKGGLVDGEATDALLFASTLSSLASITRCSTKLHFYGQSSTWPECLTVLLALKLPQVISQVPGLAFSAFLTRPFPRNLAEMETTLKTTSLDARERNAPIRTQTRTQLCSAERGPCEETRTQSRTQFPLQNAVRTQERKARTQCSQSAAERSENAERRGERSPRYRAQNAVFSGIEDHERVHTHLLRAGPRNLHEFGDVANHQPIHVLANRSDLRDHNGCGRPPRVPIGSGSGSAGARHPALHGTAAHGSRRSAVFRSRALGPAAEPLQGLISFLYGVAWALLASLMIRSHRSREESMASARERLDIALLAKNRLMARLLMDVEDVQPRAGLRGDVFIATGTGVGLNMWSGVCCDGRRVYFSPRGAADIVVLELACGDLRFIPTGRGEGVERCREMGLVVDSSQRERRLSGSERGQLCRSRFLSLPRSLKCLGVKRC